MTQTISPGRWRGLNTASSQNHVFAILAFDQRGSYRKMLPDDTAYEAAAQIKRDVVVTLAPHATAVLLDPIYGLQAALDMSGQSGILMAIEKTGYSGEATARRVDFIDGWNASKIKQMGASAAKLLVYYHPDAGTLTEEIETLVQNLAAECHRHDLPLFVEPLSYSLDNSVPKNSATFAQKRPAIVRETARRLSKLGPDVLKLEFPVDVAFNDDESIWQEACEAVSTVCDAPWVLLSAGVDFEIFERQVQIASRAGASGFLGGRAIWKEAIAMTTPKRQRFLDEIATERLHELSAIVSEYARPWTDFYSPVETSENWFSSYHDMK